MMTPALLVAVATAGAVAPAIPATDPLVIESDSTCPSAQAIRDTLAGLQPASTWPRTTVAIYAQGNFVLVALGSRSSIPRQVAVSPDCGARATTVALIIATWLGELPAEAVAPPSPPPPSAPAREPPSASPPPHRIEIGAGLLAALVGGVAPGIRVELTRLRPAGDLGWKLSLALPGPRGVAVGGGTTHFARAAASLALEGRLATRRYVLSGDGGLAAAYTLAWGEGYTANQTDQSVTWGLAAGLRAGIPWGRVRIWTDLRIFRWLYEQSVQVDSNDNDGTAKLPLPGWDVHVALGASLVF
jgi:hypothetical protein